MSNFKITVESHSKNVDMLVHFVEEVSKYMSLVTHANTISDEFSILSLLLAMYTHKHCIFYILKSQWQKIKMATFKSQSFRWIDSRAKDMHSKTWHLNNLIANSELSFRSYLFELDIKIYNAKNNHCNNFDKSNIIEWITRNYSDYHIKITRY